MRSRIVARRLLAAAAGVVVLAGAIEAVLRVFPAVLPSEIQRLAVADPRIGTAAHPYVGLLNAAGPGTDPHGFRNEWPWPERPVIVTLGDSVTLGTGVEGPATWPAQVSRAFPVHGVVNLAVAATGPQQYLRVLETFGAGLRIRLVVVGFFVGNDFWDAAMFEQWLESGAEGHYLAWRDLGRPPRRSRGLWKGELLVRSTSLGRLLLNASGRVGGRMPSATRIFDARDGTRLELWPEALATRTRHARPDTDVFRRVLDALRRIDTLARDAGARTLVVFLPSKEEVYLPLLGEPLPDLAAPLRRALEDAGIGRLDLLDGFREAAAGGDPLFVPGASPLPNARGHALIAEIVIAHLRARAADYGL